jgi:hypothetical protein
MRYKLSKNFSIGSSETSAVVLYEGILSGFVVTGSVITGSLVSFLVSDDDSDYIPLLDNSSSEVSLTVSASPRAYSFDLDTFRPWRYIKARLGTSGSAKLQATYVAGVEFIFDTR